MTIRPILRLASVLVAAGLVAVPVAVASGGAEITYLANEGFLLQVGETKVLIDALFPGIRGYPEPSEELRRALSSGRSPFDGVDLVLATHFHGDHFGAREVSEYLRANPGAQFISTEQAVEALVKEVGEVPENARSIYPKEGETLSVTIDGVELTLFNLHHGRDRRPPVQNLGFLVDLGGFKILHIGDTEVGIEEIRALELGKLGIDLALLPAWYLTEPRWRPAVAEIGAGRIVAMHLASPDAPSSWFGSAGSRDGRVRLIRDAYPEAWIPLAPLERQRFGAESAAN